MEILAVTDRKQCRGDFQRQLARLAASGVAAILLREKDLPREAYLELARACRATLRGTGVPLIVTHDPEAARRLGISAVQLSFAQMASLHGTLGDFSRVLVSIHSVAEAEQAARWGAGGLIAGHIFATDCKRGLAPRGIAFLREVCGAVPLPVYAIGGVTGETWPLLAQTGAAGACVMSRAMAEGPFFWQA